MEPDATTKTPTPHRLRVWLRRILVAGIMLPPTAFGLSNLWLASAWGRAAIADRIHLRCGLETRIQSASWSPWHGITIGGLAIAQPAALGETMAEPLLRVESVRIEPMWSELLHHRLSIRALTVDQPRLVLTVEMMSHLAQQAQPPPAIPLAATPAAAPPPGTASRSSPPPAPGPDAATSPPSPPATPAAEPPREPTRWLHLRSASCQLRSVASQRVLLEATGVDGDLPLAGAPATSRVGMATLAVGGATILSGFHAGLVWQAPVLTLQPDPPTTSIAGLQVRFAGQLALLPGLPVQFAAELPRQPLAQPVPRLDLTAEAGSVLVQARFLGSLLAPGSWQGDLAGTAADIAIRQGGRPMFFDEGSCAAVIRGGMLSCTDARLVGEAQSLLGNGTLLADGRLAAVVRLVAPPETTAAAARQMFPELTSPPRPLPLSTPGRVALDLSLSGTIHQPVLTLGEDAPPAPLPTPTAPP